MSAPDLPDDVVSEALDKDQSFTEFQNEWNLISACQYAQRGLTWKKIAKIFEDTFDEDDVIVETEGFEKGSRKKEIIRLIPKNHG